MHDLVPFLVVFLITLFSFTGGLYLLLQEEERKSGITTNNFTAHNHEDEAGYVKQTCTHALIQHDMISCSLNARLNIAGVIL